MQYNVLVCVCVLNTISFVLARGSLLCLSVCLSIHLYLSLSLSPHLSFFFFLSISLSYHPHSISFFPCFPVVCRHNHLPKDWLKSCTGLLPRHPTTQKREKKKTKRERERERVSEKKERERERTQAIKQMRD